jgi:hypothetical protein
MAKVRNPHLYYHAQRIIPKMCEAFRAKAKGCHFRQPSLFNLSILSRSFFQ